MFNDTIFANQRLALQLATYTFQYFSFCSSHILNTVSFDGSAPNKAERTEQNIIKILTGEHWQKLSPEHKVLIMPRNQSTKQKTMTGHNVTATNKHTKKEAADEQMTNVHIFSQHCAVVQI